MRFLLQMEEHERFPFAADEFERAMHRTFFQFHRLSFGSYATNLCALA
jgi:hypothetical protein